MKSKVLEAIDYAIEKHEGQVRKFSNLPYFHHPLKVANTFSKLFAESFPEEEYADLMCVCYLHDTLEDTDTSYTELLEIFGENVAEMVLELTNDIPTGQDKKMYQLGKMSNMPSNVLTIKLLDRLCNIDDLLDGEKAKDQIKFVKKYVYDTEYIMNNLLFRERVGVIKISHINMCLIKEILAKCGTTDAVVILLESSKHRE